MYSLCGEIGLYYFPIDLFDKKVEIANNCCLIFLAPLMELMVTQRKAGSLF